DGDHERDEEDVGPHARAPGRDVSVALLEKTERDEEERADGDGERDDLERRARAERDRAERRVDRPADRASEHEHIAKESARRDVSSGLPRRDDERRAERREPEPRDL